MTWWVATWFVYWKTSSTDPDLALYRWPVQWMWYYIGDGFVGWLAMSHITTFVVYLIVSFAEFVAWIIYVGDKTPRRGRMFAFWASSIGFYGSIISYPIPPVMAAFHFFLPNGFGGLAGSIGVNYSYQDLFLITGGTIVWILCMLVHIYFH